MAKRSRIEKEKKKPLYERPLIYPIQHCKLGDEVKVTWTDVWSKDRVVLLVNPTPPTDKIYTFTYGKVLYVDKYWLLLAAELSECETEEGAYIWVFPFRVIVDIKVFK